MTSTPCWQNKHEREAGLGPFPSDDWFSQMTDDVCLARERMRSCSVTPVYRNDTSGPVAPEQSAEREEYKRKSRPHSLANNAHLGRPVPAPGNLVLGSSQSTRTYKEASFIIQVLSSTSESAHQR